VKRYFGIHKPCEPIRLDPSQRTKAVVAIAEAILKNRDVSLTPILADALEDAGFGTTRALAYLRRGHSNASTLNNLLRTILVDSTIPIITPDDYQDADEHQEEDE